MPLCARWQATFGTPDTVAALHPKLMTGAALFPASRTACHPNLLLRAVSCELRFLGGSTLLQPEHDHPAHTRMRPDALRSLGARAPSALALPRRSRSLGVPPPGAHTHLAHQLGYSRMLRGWGKSVSSLSRSASSSAAAAAFSDHSGPRRKAKPHSASLLGVNYTELAP